MALQPASHSAAGPAPDAPEGSEYNIARVSHASVARDVARVMSLYERAVDSWGKALSDDPGAEPDGMVYKRALYGDEYARTAKKLARMDRRPITLDDLGTLDRVGEACLALAREVIKHQAPVDVESLYREASASSRPYSAAMELSRPAFTPAPSGGAAATANASAAPPLTDPAARRSCDPRLPRFRRHRDPYDPARVGHPGTLGRVADSAWYRQPGPERELAAHNRQHEEQAGACGASSVDAP